MHTHNPHSHHGLCMHFHTYGQSLGHEPEFDIDCSRLKPPPPSLCYDHTGLGICVADAFFAVPKNEARFQEALDQIQRFLDKHDDHVGCVAIVVSCYYGMGRSVAMAERLATVLERWTRLSVHCKHLDLKREMEKQKKAKEQEHLVREVEKNWPRIVHWIVVWRRLDREVDDILKGR